MPADPSQMKLRVPAEIVELIRGCHPLLKGKFRAGLRHITTDPETGKALKDELEGLKSYRIGKFRIIYRTASQRIIDIVAIGTRQSIYGETYRIIKKETESQRWSDVPTRGQSPGIIGGDY